MAKKLTPEQIGAAQRAMSARQADLMEEDWKKSPEYKKEQAKEKKRNAAKKTTGAKKTATKKK